MLLITNIIKFKDKTIMKYTYSNIIIYCPQFLHTLFFAHTIQLVQITLIFHEHSGLLSITKNKRKTKTIGEKKCDLKLNKHKMIYKKI